MNKNQENNISSVSKDLLKKKNRKRLGIILTGCFAVCVAVGVFFSIRHFGSALNHTNKVIACEETVNLHQHTDECYGIDEDGNEILICGYADYLVHSHNQYCYNDDNELICPLAEVEDHIHDDSCYVEEKVLICDLEEVTEDDFAEEEIIEDEFFEEEVIEDDIDEEFLDEEVFDDDIEFLDDAESPLAGQYHVHDETCYEIRKVLACGENELHTHDEDCFDEYGNLTCELLELKEHVHTADCVVKRELTEEEIAALDKADPNAKTNLAEVFFTKVFENEEYRVTVTYDGLAEIPEEAELVVKEVSLTDDQLKAVGAVYADDSKEETVEDLSEIETKAEEQGEEPSEDAEEKATVYKALDICFMLDGVEIEPKTPVKVDVKFFNADFDDDEMTVTHIKDDGSTEVVGEQTVDEFSELSVTTDSFSVFVYATKGKQQWDPNEGWYGGKYYKYNNVKDAFVNDDSFAKYRRANGALGVYASNFHIVAFDTAYTNVHTNGNILAKNIQGNANFGTNNYNDEISYIQNIKSTGAMETGGGSGKALVIGESNPVRTEDNGNKLRFYSADWSSSTSSGESSATLFMKDLDTANAPFIDFNNVRAEIDGIQNSFKSQAAVNTDVRLDRNYIKITDPDSAGYCTLTAQQVNSLGNDFSLVGFQSGKQGSLIINVNCAGANEVKIPTRSYVYFDSTFNWDGTLQNKGKCAPTNEVTEFSGGKVIWNLYNTKEGMKVNVEQTTGIILAPNCDVFVNMMNGNVVGRNVTITGESHRTDFTGTTIPFAAQLHATKTVDGRVPNGNEKFDFSLYEIINGVPTKLQTVKNNGSNILFNKVTYGKDSDVGTHWYFIKEDKPQGNTQYVFDDAAYIIKTVVSKSGNTYNAKSEYFKTTYTDIEIQKNVTVMTNNKVDESSLSFNNLDSTSITVEKKWVSEDGTTPLTTDLPESITVKLMQTVNGTAKQYGDDVTLTKAKNYTYKWESLPRQDDKGNVYTYHVEENPVEGFTQKITGDPVKLTDGTYTLTNVKNPEKVSVHIKKKFYLVENEQPRIDSSLEVTDPTLFRSGKYPEGWEVMATLYVSPDGGKNWDQCRPAVVFGKDYDKLPEDKKLHYTTSAGTFVQGNKASFDLTHSTNWELTINDLPKSGIYYGHLPQYGQYVDFTYKVMERMSCWSIFQYDYDNYTLNGAQKALDVGGNVFVPDLLGGDTKYEPKVEGGFIGDDKYDYTLHNFGDGFIDIDILKNWWTVEGGVDSIQNGANDEAFITLELRETVTDKKIANYKLTKDSLIEVDDDGNPVGSPLYETEALTNNHNLWSGKIKHLEKYVIKNGKLMFADYDITEKVVSEEGENKFVYGSYVCTNVNIAKNSNDPKEWTITTVTLDNKNTESYELPRTGGSGTLIGLIKHWIRNNF